MYCQNFGNPRHGREHKRDRVNEATEKRDQRFRAEKHHQ